MPQEASVELKEVRGVDLDLWNETLSLDGHSEHILTNSFEVNDQDHVVELWEAWHELNVDLGLFASLKLAFVVGYVEFGLLAAAVAGDSDDILDVDL